MTVNVIDMTTGNHQVEQTQEEGLDGTQIRVVIKDVVSEYISSAASDDAFAARKAREDGRKVSA